ncbi:MULTISPECIES: RNase adapter RapZ [unclassified Iodidimonas]|jgi:UPF0042 nucleotide-binding protein|uniref:RNase adapter RapZ n=1 Tax=unclassified Iodidimonas TaxID=2626145 RepID=UPI0024824BFD|nr:MULTISPECIES: RNase adapter RapZ [unclassified Iodidimonas]
MPATASDPCQKIIIVTGMNGAGKSTALKIFEDLGYEAVDNLPLSLLTRLLKTGHENEKMDAQRPIAVGVDSRTRAFMAPEFLHQVASLVNRPDFSVSLLFFDCDDDVLVQRYSETRRRHPLAHDRPVKDGIVREREIMAPVKARADFIYDTANQTVHDLKRRLTTRYSLEKTPALLVNVMSFGFSRGLPRDSDLVFDVRFLRNPNYEPALKNLTGREQAVADYIARDKSFDPFFTSLSDMVSFLLPLYRDEGKSYVTIACGCTGGRHRSVFVAQKLGRVLEDDGYQVNIIHRDATYGPVEE